MKKHVFGWAFLAVFALGNVEVALAGGGGGGKQSYRLLTDAEIAECAKDPALLEEKTKGKRSSVKANAAARVIDKIIEDEGADSPKVADVVSDALGALKLTPTQLGRMMRNSPNKNQVLAIFVNEYSAGQAQSFADASGAVFVKAPDAGDGEGEQEDTGTGDQGPGDDMPGGQTTTTTPPPTQNQPQTSEQESTTTPPPQPPVGPGYAGQQLL